MTPLLDRMLNYHERQTNIKISLYLYLSYQMQKRLILAMYIHIIKF